MTRFFTIAPVLLALATPLAALSAQAAPSIARLVITPASRTIVAGDTMRLRTEARDAQGNVLAGVTVRYRLGGSARFEGKVDSLGLLTASSTAVLPVTVTATMPGAAPVFEVIDITAVPGPAARIELSPSTPKLVVGQRVRATARAYSATGDVRADRIAWSSDNAAVASVSATGLITALRAGRASIVATSGAISQRLPVVVAAASLSSLSLTPGHVEARTGDVLRFAITAKDAAGKTIAGLTPTWSFSPGQGQIDADGAFVGYEPGEYTITASFGARSVESTITLAPRDVRRPLSLVGRLPRTRFTTEEVWLHQDGKHAYLGSGGGGDVLYALDISNPADPKVTDSIVSNTRRVNDVMTFPDGKFLVFTREGASDRKNGIVIASLEDPAHPKPIAEFTDGVTGGVHSAFVYKQDKYGTFIFLTNDGTGALHVIDVNDPYHPKEVARWKTEGRPDAGRSLHDIDLRDGLLYASYWNDGLIVLDVGNGVKGGSPSNPVKVSQFKYDLNAMYKQVEVDGGPGFIRGTHTAWRHKNYVFIADEVFPAAGPKGTKDASAGRAYGRLQVVDVSDIANPKAVAFYEPEHGGVHNLWVAGDSLYMGAYNAGFRVFDISGELRGDLRAQGREIGHLNTADMDGKVKNAAMTWGVVVNPKDGLAYVNDDNNGLWIVRIEPKPVKKVIP
ncbi:MAG: Ig-like domain-containing protein [Gemmatimonadota bacterium]|nr:Ig-like domain-containing protein [Gemmatimonadota bacterium]MDQ8168644.1 Ig-like domain-containing protein [Gemmatimonadota bacterium]MDQ8172431.1 Ig-like domain-containing protein [Gemmatimonadota bacterium]